VAVLAWVDRIGNIGVSDPLAGVEKRSLTVFVTPVAE
jgi:hypothetical protein